MTITIDPLPTFRSDRIALDQIFTNLIDNAVKYLTPETKGLIEVSGEWTTSGVIVRVKDNGRGIDPQDHERVFELFRRAGPQDQPGEGIGLANVRAIVKRLDGTIVLQSSLGRGCIFAVDLPEMQI